MQVKQEKRHIVDILFVLALFGVFAFSALVLVILGANVYKQTVSSMSQNFDSRTASSYIIEKVRQNDIYDSIYIDSLEGVNALVLTQESSGSLYNTYIYYHDGELKELFTSVDKAIGSNTLESGTTIMELNDFDLSYINEQLLSITLTTADEESKTLYISLHSPRKED